MKKTKDSGMHGRRSLEYFKRLVPRNPIDWIGNVVLYSTWNQEFYNVAFGDGTNLTESDSGFNEYIMADSYEMDGTVPLEDIIAHAKNEGRIIGDEPGIKPVDGMCWTLRRREWRDGDIRRFLMEGLICAGYGVAGAFDDWSYRDIVYIGSDYDVWRPGEKKAQNKKKGKSK